jgi:hypothetical protein
MLGFHAAPVTATGRKWVRHSFLQRGEGGSLVPQSLLCQAPIAGAADR